MSEKKPCENCGDPNCSCPPGKCDCKPKAATQPSDKYLPKEDKGDFKDKTINKPVNPFQPAKCPLAEGFFKDIQKVAGGELHTFAKSEWFADAIQNLKDFKAFADANTTEDVRFYPGICTAKQGNDGYWAVQYNYVREARHPYSTINTFSKEQANYVAFDTLSQNFVVSKHFDARSAELARSDYNIFLGAASAPKDHPVVAMRS